MPGPLSEIVFWGIFLFKVRKKPRTRVHIVGLRIIRCAVHWLNFRVFGRVHPMQVIPGRMFLTERTVGWAARTMGSQLLEEWEVCVSSRVVA